MAIRVLAESRGESRTRRPRTPKTFAREQSRMDVSTSWLTRLAHSRSMHEDHTVQQLQTRVWQHSSTSLSEILGLPAVASCRSGYKPPPAESLCSSLCKTARLRKPHKLLSSSLLHTRLQIHMLPFCGTHFITHPIVSSPSMLNSDARPPIWTRHKRRPPALRFTPRVFRVATNI